MMILITFMAITCTTQRSTSAVWSRKNMLSAWPLLNAFNLAILINFSIEYIFEQDSIYLKVYNWSQTLKIIWFICGWFMIQLIERYQWLFERSEPASFFSECLGRRTSTGQLLFYQQASGIDIVIVNLASRRRLVFYLAITYSIWPKFAIIVREKLPVTRADVQMDNIRVAETQTPLWGPKRERMAVAGESPHRAKLENYCRTAPAKRIRFWYLLTSKEISWQP